MSGTIRRVTNFEQFEKLYKIFEEPPYNEKFTREEVFEIYNELISLGHIDGYFLNNNLIGCIGYRRMITDEHPVKYDYNEQVAYFAEIIVQREHRGHGFGTELINHMLKCLKSEGYSKVYMRTLQPEQSMSYRIAVNCGFSLMKGIVQEVESPRTTEDRSTVDIRIFLEKNL